MNTCHFGIPTESLYGFFVRIFWRILFAHASFSACAGSHLGSNTGATALLVLLLLTNDYKHRSLFTACCLRAPSFPATCYSQLPIYLATACFLPLAVRIFTKLQKLPKAPRGFMKLFCPVAIWRSLFITYLVTPRVHCSPLISPAAYLSHVLYSTCPPPQPPHPPVAVSALATSHLIPSFSVHPNPPSDLCVQICVRICVRISVRILF